MVDVDEAYLSVGLLKLVVLAVGGEIGISALVNGFVDEFSTTASAEGNRLNHRLGGTRITHVGTLQFCANLFDEIDETYRFGQLADDTETALCKEAIVGDPEFVRECGIDTSGNAVEVGVGRINSDIMPDGLFHDEGLRGLSADLFETVKKERMVRDDELTPAHNSLIDHIRCNVCGQEDGLNIASCVTYLHSRVIPIRLGTPWRYRFYAIDDGS